MPYIFGPHARGLVWLSVRLVQTLSGADVWVGLVVSWWLTSKSLGNFVIVIIISMFKSAATIPPNSELLHLYSPLSSHVRNVHGRVYAYALYLLFLHRHYQICVSADSPLCPHVFGFCYYLVASNKQFMPLNWGNTLYPDTWLSNHLDFLSLCSLGYGKQNTWL